MKKDLKNSVDLYGAIASMACAVHCMALPVLVSLGLMSTTHHGHTFDYIMLALGLGFAIYSLGKNYGKHHSWTPIGLAILGFIVLIGGIIAHIGIISAIGGVFIAYAHYQNHRLTALCKA